MKELERPGYEIRADAFVKEVIDWSEGVKLSILAMNKTKDAVERHGDMREKTTKRDNLSEQAKKFILSAIDSFAAEADEESPYFNRVVVEFANMNSDTFEAAKIEVDKFREKYGALEVPMNERERIVQNAYTERGLNRRTLIYIFS